MADSNSSKVKVYVSAEVLPTIYCRSDGVMSNFHSTKDSIMEIEIPSTVTIYFI